MIPTSAASWADKVIEAAYGVEDSPDVDQDVKVMLLSSVTGSLASTMGYRSFSLQRVLWQAAISVRLPWQLDYAKSVSHLVHLLERIAPQFAGAALPYDQRCSNLIQAYRNLCSALHGERITS